MQIDIDFDVFKALTNLRDTETTTYNDVVRRLLNLRPPIPPARQSSLREESNNYVLKGIEFPEGTLFRVTYKGRTYTAQIQRGAWVGEDGRIRNTPSDAATAITHTNVNGWKFWECKRPSDITWRRMDMLRNQND